LYEGGTRQLRSHLFMYYIFSIKINSKHVKNFHLVWRNLISLFFCFFGQTKRKRDEREKEHDRAIKNKTPDLSAVAAHCLEMGHSRGPCKVVKEVNNTWELDAWELLFIMNEDEEKLMNVGEPPINSKLFKFARKTPRRN
jgi:hypothetical protein